MKSSFSEIIKSDTPVLVDFFAEWCGPCKTLAPILKEVKDALGERITVIKIDVDKNQSFTSTHNVRGVPTLVLYKNGKQVWRQSGVIAKKDLLHIIKTS